MTINVRRLRDMPRWRDADGNPRRLSDREPINVHPNTIKRLRTFLETTGRATGIGYTEFIDMSIDLWEAIEADSIINGVAAEYDKAREMTCDDCGRTDGTHNMEVEH